MNAFFKEAFPELETEGCTQTSPASEKYNCIAWAAGDQTEWWWPYEHPAYYWPDGLSRVVTFDGFFQMFISLGYERCAQGNLEAGFEKVAIYGLDGKPTHVVGVPLHWGFTGQARKGYGANTLTPSVGDANTQTPEFKAFLVNLEKTTAPAA